MLSVQNENFSGVNTCGSSVPCLRLKCGMLHLESELHNCGPKHVRKKDTQRKFRTQIKHKDDDDLHHYHHHYQRHISHTHTHTHTRARTYIYIYIYIYIYMWTHTPFLDYWKHIAEQLANHR